jgi:tRNA U34 5-methylaminomethyl-2-thiouridine-forming methyltransferase MnmC
MSFIDEIHRLRRRVEELEAERDRLSAQIERVHNNYANMSLSSDTTKDETIAAQSERIAALEKLIIRAHGWLGGDKWRDSDNPDQRDAWEAFRKELADATPRNCAVSTSPAVSDEQGEVK